MYRLTKALQWRAPLRVPLLALLLLNVLAPLPAPANVGYGVSAYEYLRYSFGPPTNLIQYYYSSSTGGWLPQTSYSAPPVGNSGTLTYSNGSIIYTDGASTAVNALIAQNGELHDWATSGAGTFNPAASAIANADANISWRDVLIVGGLPYGTPVQLMVTDYLYSAVSTGVSYGRASTNGAVYYNMQLYGPLSDHLDIQLNNIAPSPVFVQKVTQVMRTEAGIPLTFLLQMGAIADGAATGGIWTADANAGNTAFANIQVLTPGATLSSESGIDYSTLSEVPEPSSMSLLATAVFAVGAILKRSLKKA